MGCATNEHYGRLILLAPVTHVACPSEPMTYLFAHSLCFGAANIMVYVVLLGKCEKMSDRRRPKAKLSELATTAFTYKCGCGKFCINQIGKGKDVSAKQQIDQVKNYMRPWFWMQRDEHRKKFAAVVDGLTTGQTVGGDRVGDLKIAMSSSESYVVCPDAFALSRAYIL